MVNIFDEPTVTGVSQPAVFDAEPDWRFPLRVACVPGTDLSTILDGHGDNAGEGVPLRETTLDVGGLRCDILVVQGESELRTLTEATTVSANFVFLLGHAVQGIDRTLAVAASRSVGAIGYAKADVAPGRVTVFIRDLTRGATIEDALRALGPYALEGDSDALAVAPLESFLQRVAATTRVAATGPDSPGSSVPADSEDRPASSRPRGPLSYPGPGTILPPLRVPPTTGRPSALQDLAGSTEAYRRWIRQPGGAAIAAALAGDPSVIEELDRPRAGPAGVSRFLQAALHRREGDGTLGPRIGTSFLRSRPMTLVVGIGPLGPTRLVADVALDETQLGDPGPDGWELEITLKPKTGDIARRTLYLPVSGSTDDVMFPLDIEPTADWWHGRLTVWHRSRAIQSAVLSGPVLDNDMYPEAGQHLSLIVDGEFHPMAGLDTHSAGGATVELDAKPAVYSSSGDFLIEPREEEMRNASSRIATKLGEMAVELDEVAGLDDPRARALLEYLAVQGFLLLRAMFPNQQQRDAVRRENFLQAIRLSDAAPELPYEFIYDFPSPSEDFTVCSDWTDGISTGVCPRCHLTDADNGETLCPLGFWGLSKVIERHNAVGQAERQAQARLRRGDIAGRTPVSLKRAAIALSVKADRVPRGAPETYIPPSRRISQALEDAGLPFDGPIDDWEAWRTVITGHQPDLLIVLGHARFDDRRGEWSMQIGADSDLHLTQIEDGCVDTTSENPGPVVFLFGCLTASEGAEQATFARMFREHRASVVVGTTSTVLGRQAGPVAAQLVAAVKTTAGLQPLGELLRRSRATGLAEGSLMAMALNAFGDADYRLTV